MRFENILGRPCKWEALKLACIISLLGHQASHPSFDGFGSEGSEMRFGAQSKTDGSTPGVSLDCAPAIFGIPA